MDTGVFQFADSLGPAKILYLQDQQAGLQAIVVVDNVVLGTAIGGVRMAVDVTAEEAFRLARAMTLKNSVAGLPHGGGKSVIIGDPAMDLRKKEQIIRAFARGIQDFQEYVPGPDMGTNELCMGWIKEEIGRAIGLPRKMGGIPLDEIGATGWGVSHAIDAALRRMDQTVSGKRVVVQGFGAVGSHAARFLALRGAVIVAVGDVDSAVIDPDGLDMGQLWGLHENNLPISEYVGGRKAAPEALLEIPCDIWIPAARPDVIHMDNVHRLNTKMIAQGANIPLTLEAEEWLHQQGVLVLPDFIANAGGVICGAMEYAGSDDPTVFRTIRERVRMNVEQMLEMVAREKITPRKAGMKMALARIQEAKAHPRVA